MGALSSEEAALEQQLEALKGREHRLQAVVEDIQLQRQQQSLHSASAAVASTRSTNDVR